MTKNALLGHTFEWMLIVAAFAALVAYCYGVLQQRRRGRSWSRWRTASFSSGVLLLVFALLPPVAAFAHHDLRGHMLQHLLLGMFAPLGLVLAAPTTLVMRNLPKHTAGQLVKLLRTGFVYWLSHPITALLLNVGGMYVLYLTPLYASSLSNGFLHGWLHVHFIIAGCLFTWAIAGPDPGPERPPHAYRLVVLFASIAAHSFLAKVMYAYGWPKGTEHGIAEIRAAAQLMYYGGDLAELFLAAVLFVNWYPKMQAPPLASRL